MYLMQSDTGRSRLYGSYMGLSDELEMMPIFWNHPVTSIDMTSSSLSLVDERKLFWEMHDIIESEMSYYRSTGLQTLIVFSTFKKQFSIELMSVKFAQLFDRKIWTDEKSKLLFDQLKFEDDFPLEQFKSNDQKQAGIHLINESYMNANVCIRLRQFDIWFPYHHPCF